MGYVKTAIFTTLVLLVALVGYIFVTFNSDYELNIAADSFAKREYDKALKELNTLNGVVPAARLNLYQGYVYRGLRQWKESDQALAQAAFNARKHQQPNLLLEIYLNQALNSYLQKNPTTLKAAIAGATEVDAQDPWVEFFQGVQAYQDERFADSLRIWTQPNHRLPLSGWMRKAFDEVFTPLWLSLHIARSQIEIGQYLAARQSLEEELKKAKNEDKAEIEFLIGLSYAKEASEKPIQSAAPYYKLAVSYINRVPIQQEHFAQERQRLLKQIVDTMQQLIRAGSFADLSFYVSILEGWGANGEFGQINTQLLELLHQNLQAGRWSQAKELAALLSRMIPEGEERNQLQKRLAESAHEALQSGDIDGANHYWEASRLFSRDPAKASQEFSDTIGAQLLAIIPKADTALKSMGPMLQFWQSVATDPAARFAFANQLVTIATNMLQTGDQDKAINLIKTALSLVDDTVPPSLHKQVEESFAGLYAEAVKKGDVENLPRLLTTIQSLGLEDIDIQKDQQVNQQLATTESLLTNGDFQQALSRGKWILALDPGNQRARRIVGQVLYWQAKYAEALPYLLGIASPDFDVLEMIGVSQMLSGHPQEGMRLLESVARKRALNRDSVMRIGLGLLANGDAAGGQTWLSQISKPDAEVSAGLAYAAYVQGRWADALNAIKQIPAPGNAMEGVQGMAVLSEVGTKDTLGAEKRLMALLAMRDPAQLHSLSPAFLAFERNVLRQFDRFAVAAFFFHTVKQQNEIALKYINLVKDPLPNTRILKSQILLALQRPVEAVQELEIAYAETTDAAVKRRIMPMLAQALTDSGRALEALNWYQNYFTADPENLSHREAYAVLLMRLLRFDLAVEQLGLLSQKRGLTPYQTVLYMQSLINTGKNDEAIPLGETALKENSGLSLAQKLDVAREMVIINQQTVTWPLLKQIPPIGQLNVLETIALIRFLLEIGSYDQAVALSKDRESSIIKDPTALLAVAELSLRLGDDVEALKRAEEALSLSPDDPNVLAFIQRHTHDVEKLQKESTLARQRVDESPDSVGANLQYARAIDALAHATIRNQQPLPKLLQLELQRALFAVGKLLRDVQGVPELFYLQGDLQALQGNAAPAIDALLTAGRLAPSYADALMRLAQLYKAQNDDKRAIAILYQVTRYHPDNADAWQLLAELYAADGYLYEASTFYENAIKYRPLNMENYLAFAQVLLELRDPEGAKAILLHASQLQPNNIHVLKLLLRSLFDSALLASAQDPKEIAKEQQAALQRLKALDPKEAEKFLADLRKAPKSPLDFSASSSDFTANPLFFPEIDPSLLPEIEGTEVPQKIQDSTIK